jgi:hypothetical protein
LTTQREFDVKDYEVFKINRGNAEENTLKTNSPKNKQPEEDVWSDYEDY